MSVLQGIVRFASRNPGSTAQILFSAVLACATIAYTFGVFRQVSEMRTDRLTRNKPLVTPTIDTKYAVNHFFAIENTGEGVAYDVEAEWWCDEGDKQTWKIPLLSPGERRTFPLPFGGEDGTITTSGQIEDAAGRDAVIEFRVRYSDSLGNRYTPEKNSDEATASIGVLDTIQTREDAEEYVDESPVKAIADEMEEVTKRLERIERSIEMEYLEGNAKQEIRDRLTELVREEGVLTFGELVDSLSLDKTVVAGMVYELRGSGQVDFDETDGFPFKDSDVEIEYVDNG
ncbi:hypothetical protein ACFR9U_16175 [Halorientalis brevis]|uniref:Uncharacterized protein n=1 Tax=Halorientalis brevis TaxID=1126241 RepID=A0ABD6CEQ0_9EURY|nr:hypothetical protein [Halorientalis brevis]